MGRCERRELQRITRGKRPDNLSDAGRAWFLGYPADRAKPTILNVLFHSLQWAGFALVAFVFGRAWRRRRAQQP